MIFTLGPKGTYANQAALKYFPDSQINFEPSIQDVFEQVKKHKNAFGVLPLENMIEGTVRETFDLLYETELKIHDTIELEIHHCLLAQSDNFEIITSHPQALAQCRKTLNKKYKNKLTQTSASTANAAAQAAEHPQYAAIANRFAAETYELNIIDENLEDYQNNRTAFAIISHKPNPTPYSKTVVALRPIKDEAGLLIKLLYPFQENGINLTKLESRPQKDSLNNYIFFIEFEADYRQARAHNIFRQLEKDLKICEVKILGGKV